MRLGANEASRGSGVPICELRGDVRSLSAEEFADRHGYAFLMLTAAELSLPRGFATTGVLLDDERAPGETTASLALLVYPLRLRQGSRGPLVTIGRGAQNDVIVPDQSISRFHAFVKEAPDGSWRLLDAGSTNGTTQNGRSVPSQGNGEPVALKTGDNLRFGQVELTFLDADALRGFAAKLER